MQASSNAPAPSEPALVIRTLQESDLPVADRVMRLAFGTFIGMSEPASFMGDAGLVIPRWKTSPGDSLAAELRGEVVGSVFASNWGSVVVFGPMSLRPDLWGQGGIVARLAESAIELADTWGVQHRGLFTFAQSPKHVGLYAKLGFFPRFLTCVMFSSVGRAPPPPPWTEFSRVPAKDQPSCLAACKELTDSVYSGLDLSREIQGVERLKMGDTVLLWDGDRLDGLAVCHTGPGTEAGSDVCYVKFGVVRSGQGAEERFTRLLDACDAFARERGLKRLVAGMNTARHEAFKVMLNRGFRTDMTGIVMQSANEPAYNRPGIFLVDDWR